MSAAFEDIRVDRVKAALTDPAALAAFESLMEQLDGAIGVAVAAEHAAFLMRGEVAAAERERVRADACERFFELADEERKWERARADRAEALDRAAYYYRRELREIIQDCGHDAPDIRKIRERAESAIRAADHELAALSAGSGGRETTP